MQILDRITEQLSASELPLVAVTVAALPCPDTPVVLTLHWHGFAREKLVEREEAEAVRFAPVPSSALQINERWTDLLDLDLSAMEAGWELGAWDLARSERPACMRPGASAREALECRQAFGQFPYGPGGSSFVLSDIPDAEDLLDAAGRRGYLLWKFRPVHRGIWGDVAEDATLSPDGTRNPPCPLLPERPRGEGCGHTLYRFGTPGSLSLTTG